MDFLTNAAAGALAGMAVDSVLFPLDTIKTRLQARRMGQPVPQRSFYRGLLSAMLGSAPSAATFWVGYEGAKARLHQLTGVDGKWSFLAPAGAAAVADIMVCAVRNPFEVVKQQMQTGLHASTGAAVRTILRTDGWRGLYAGYFSTVLREIPFDAIEFSLYEKLKHSRKAEKAAAAASGTASGGHHAIDLILWENALLGSLAGGVAAAVTTPLDVIKTRLMTQTKTASADRYKGWSDAFTRIYREEGASAFFSGIKPRVAWITVGGAIFIGSFEELKRRLNGAMGGGKDGGAVAAEAGMR